MAAVIKAPPSPNTSCSHADSNNTPAISAAKIKAWLIRNMRDSAVGMAL